MVDRANFRQTPTMPKEEYSKSPLSSEHWRPAAGKKTSSSSVEEGRSRKCKSLAEACGGLRVQEARDLRSSAQRRHSGRHGREDAAAPAGWTTRVEVNNMVFYRRKPPPVEERVECTLEELFNGCKKEVRFRRDVVGKNGLVHKKEEVEIVRINPGSKKGTRITYEGKGDQRPGSIPADVVFSVSEKPHLYFKREGDDLAMRVEIPMAKALTGWSFSFRTLSGEKMRCSAAKDEILFPGYERVIRSQGMPVEGRHGARGDLRIKFGVVFPKCLSGEQKLALKDLLKNCS